MNTKDLRSKSADELNAYLTDLHKEAFSLRMQKATGQLAATHNAKLNQLPDGRVTFRAGDAADIFSVVSDFPAEKTAIIIDPPRKGCDENFIDQLLAFRSSTVVYVSCNVHTQARDVGMLLNKSEAEVKEGKKEGRYVLESVRGFDLFPQTAHVESVAVLRLVQ